jgi:pyridoxal phosphate enzyme (YggS family)
MSLRNPLRERYNEVMNRVGEAAGRVDRSANSVMMVAVTKNASPDQVRQLIDLGHQDLGENRVQQLQQRVAMTEEFMARRRMMAGAPKTEPIRWHMIGHLQRNKVKPVLPLVRLVHGVDSLRLAEEIQAQAVKADIDVDVLLEVNVSGEESKNGLGLPAVPHMAEQLNTMMHIRLRGLMTMAPLVEDPEEVRPVYTRLFELFQEMSLDSIYNENFNILSMGMSNDFEVAIECGANVIRVGRALFGEE